MKVFFTFIYNSFLDNSFTHSQCITLFLSLRTIKSLTIFTFQNNTLNEDEFLFLKKQLIYVKELKELNLFGTCLVGKCASILYELLQQLKSLKKIKLPNTIRCSSTFINAFPQIDITFSSF